MGKKKENPQETKAIVAEFSVSMYCNACERTVAKAISKLKGVEKFTTDMNNHKVVVTGKFEPQKVVKKLRKKTGKRVDILAKDDKEINIKSDTKELEEKESQRLFRDCFREAHEKEIMMMDYCQEFLTTMFSDENPNACYVM